MLDQELTEQANTRLRRIEGQVRGLQRMLERLEGCGESAAGEGEPCDSLVTQILAVRAAVEQVGLLIMEIHLRQCVLDGVSLEEERLQALRESLKLWSRLGSGPR